MGEFSRVDAMSPRLPSLVSLYLPMRFFPLVPLCLAVRFLPSFPSCLLASLPPCPLTLLPFCLLDPGLLLLWWRRRTDQVKAKVDEMGLPVTFHDAIDHAELGKYKARRASFPRQ